ncbi:hypothetical protein ACWCQP_49045 [Streptomyces chartreusis]
MLRVDLDAPRKQRHTVTRIFHRLVEEHGADVSYGMVRYYVAARKPEILVESGKAPLEAFVPQTHQPGHEAEVDFGEVHVRLAGQDTRLYLFSLRLSFSGKAVHRVFATAGQEAFFEGHVHAFRTLGGVPRHRIRYDNLRAAVERVLGRSRDRNESERWTAFRSHWGVEPFYCMPGIEGAHEKPLSSHCTSSGRFGVLGVQDASAGSADGGSDELGAGQVEDVFALVVGEDAGDDAVPSPVLDRLKVDAEVAGEFGDGQQTLVQESLAVAA